MNKTPRFTTSGLAQPALIAVNELIRTISTLSRVIHGPALHAFVDLARQVLTLAKDVDSSPSKHLLAFERAIDAIDVPLNSEIRPELFVELKTAAEPVAAWLRRRVKKGTVNLNRVMKIVIDTMALADDGDRKRLARYGKPVQRALKQQRDLVAAVKK